MLNATNLLKLERRLREEMKEILFQEEMIWKQKSRMDWLQCSDSNMMFFYTSMLIRRKKKRIVSLQDERGGELENL